MLSDGINTLVLPSLLIGKVNVGDKATALGLLSFLGLLVGMLVQPYAGSWSDRLRLSWGRRGVIGLGVLLILVALAVFGGIPALWAIILGYIFLQLAASVAQAGQQGFIPDLVPACLRGRASGLKSFMDIGGAMLGFVLLGQLLGNGRLSLMFWILGGAMVVGFIVTLLFVREKTSATAVPPASPKAPQNPFRLDLTNNKPFFWLIVSRFLFLLGTYAVGRFLLYFVSDRLGLQAAQASKQAGSLLAILALVTVLGALPSGWAVDRFGRKPVMVFGGLISALGIFLLICASSFGLMILFGSLMSIGSAAFASSNWAMSADLAPVDQGGRFFGLLNIGTAGASALAGLFGPLVDFGNRLGHNNGYVFLFLLAALVSVGSAFVLRYIPQTTQLEMRETPLVGDASEQEVI
jgi:MFS family permease